MPCSREYYRDNTEICEELKAIVLSIDPTIPEADLVINEYSDNTDVVFWLCLLLGAIGDIIPEPADDLAVYFVDGNNPNEGTGAITNPYSTIDRVIERIKGEDGNPAPTGRVTVVVRGYEGANYAVNKNMWVDANWVMSQGAKITNGGSLTSSYLFDQDEVVNADPLALPFYAQIFGEGEFTLTNKGFFRTSDVSTVTSTTRNTVSFKVVDVTNSNAIYQNAGGYPVSNSLYYDYVGSNNGGQGFIYVRGSANTAISTFESGTRDAQFSLSNIKIIDYTTSNGLGTGIIELGCQPFNTQIKDIEVQGVGAGSGHKEYGLLLTGRRDSFNLDGFTARFTTFKSFTAIQVNNSSDSGIVGSIRNVSVGFLGSGGYFMGGTWSDKVFTMSNVTSSQNFDGNASDFIGSESGVVKTGEANWVPDGKLRQLNAYTPVEETDFVPKSYVDSKPEYVSFFGNISAPNQLMSRLNNNSYRWFSIEQEAEIESISLVVNGALNTTGAGNLTVIIKQIPLDGSLTATPSNTAGTTIATESFTLPDTSGADQFGVAVGANIVNVTVDGSVTPQGLLIWTSSLTANTIKHSEIIIKLKRY